MHYLGIHDGKHNEGILGGLERVIINWELEEIDREKEIKRWRMEAHRIKKFEWVGKCMGEL